MHLLCPGEVHNFTTFFVVIIEFVFEILVSFQLCQSVDDETMKNYMEYYNISELNTYLNGSDAIVDIGQEFVEDVQIILEKFDDNTYVTKIILEMVN